MTEPFLTRRLTRRTALFSGLALAGGYLVGCGGDDDDDADPTASAAAATATETEAAQPAATTSMSTATPAATATAAEIPAAPALSAAAWERLEPAGGPPPARRDHSLIASADGRLAYAYGGRGDGGALGDLWAYDVSANSWTELAPDSARFGHSAFLGPDDGRLYIFAGEGAGFFNDVRVYDPAADSWAEVSSGGPSARYGHGGSFGPRPGTLYISHGFTDSGRFDDTWSFDLASATWVEISPAEGPRPIERCLMRIALADGRLLLFGGQTDSDPFLDDLWSFDLAAGAWTQVEGAGPSARNSYSLVAASSSKFVLFGGRTESDSVGDLWVLDSESDDWAQIPTDGQAARNGHDAVWLEGENAMLVFGGRNPDVLNDLWLARFS